MIHARLWLSVAAKAAIGATILATSTGCGVMTAMTNPKAAWALSEPSPMAVILRRGDAARATATNVDRLMNGTPVDATSKWVVKLVVKKADVEAALKDIGADPDYVVPKGAKLRVVNAEAWAKILSGLCPHESKYPSLFASVGADVATAYGEVSAQAKTIAKLKADKAEEERAIDDKDVSDADKETHRKKKQDLDDQIDKAQGEYRPKIDAFLVKLKEGAGKAPDDVKKQMPPVLVALEHAVDDAKLANSVAILRYPLAMPQMPQEVKNQAKRIVADSVEDKTGHRPSLDKLDPQVKLEGGDVKITLNGVPPEALGGLKVEAFLADVVARSKDYVKRVLTFAAYVAETQDLLDLEAEVIKTAMEGFGVDEGKTAGGDDLSDLKVEMDEIATANAAAGAVTAKGKAKSSRHPVPMTSACDKPDPAKGKAGKDKPPPKK